MTNNKAMIQDFLQKIKDRGVGRTTLELGLVISLVCTSFLGGWYSAYQQTMETTKPISIVYPTDPTILAKYTPSATKSASEPTVTTQKKPTPNTEGSSEPQSLDAKYVGSVNGTKYYPLGCSGAKRIKSENQILFVTMDEAETAGYTKSTTCSY